MFVSPSLLHEVKVSAAYAKNIVAVADETLIKQLVMARTNWQCQMEISR
jgi:hypothetical protein